MRYVTFLTTLFLLTLPLQFALSPSESIDFPLGKALVPVIFVAWVFYGLLERRLTVTFRLPTLLFLGFVGSAAIALLLADDPGAGYRKLAFLLLYTPLLFVFPSVFRDEKAARGAIRAVVVGASIAAMVAIAQFCAQFFVSLPLWYAFWITSVLPIFLGNSFGAVVAEYPSLLVNIQGETMMRASAFFPDPHIAAFYFGMAAPLAAWLALRDITGRARWSISLGIILVADILTFSRGGYLGLLFGFIPLLFLLFSGRWRKWRPWFVFCVSVLFLLFFIPPVFERAKSIISGDTSTEERLRLYGEATEFIAERPFFGYGPGNYALELKPSAEFREPIYVHSLLLDIMTETGMIGGLLFGAFLTVLFFRSIAALGGRYGPALLVSLSIFLGHSLVETPLYSVHILPLLLFLAALLSSPSSYERS